MNPLHVSRQRKLPNGDLQEVAKYQVSASYTQADLAALVDDAIAYGVEVPLTLRSDVTIMIDPAHWDSVVVGP